MSNREDLLFWTSVMRDHAEFHMNDLAPKEQEFIEKAAYFYDLFKQFHEQIKDSDNMKPIYPKLLHGLRCFIDYKRSILKNLLNCIIAMNVPPTFISHQINEANQFMMLLSSPEPKHMDKNMKVMVFTEQLKQWIMDSSGHAAMIAASLDPIEELYIQQALEFKEIFGKLTIKAMELQMMLMYTGLEDGVLKQLGLETIQKITDLIFFCEKVKEMRQACSVTAMGTFTPLVLDHFIREQQYWIMRIKEFIR